MRLSLPFLVVFTAFLAVGYASVEKPRGGERTVVLDLRQQLGVQGHAYLRKAVEYHGCYYCMFTCCGSSFSMKVNEMLFSIDTCSLETKQLPCPREFGHYKDDLFVRHDTLFLDIYGSWTKHDFYFDTVSSLWVECSELDELVYEDDDVSVYEMNNGEWGQALWFWHKKLGKECAVTGLGAVRRVGDTFFVVEPNLVRSLMLSQLDAVTPSMIDHRRASENDTAAYADKKPWLEGDTVYCDPRYNGFLSYIGKYNDTVIVGSVVAGDSLLLLVNKPDGTALMRIAGRERLQTLVSLGKRFNIKLQDLTPRGNIRAGRQVVPFVQDALSMGLLDVHDGRVDVLKMNLTIDTLPVLPTDGLDSLLTFFEAEWGSLSDNQVIAYECGHGATFMEEDSLRNGYFEDIGLMDSICRNLRFRKRVDSLYNINIQYCVRKEDRRVAAVFLNFSLPQPYLMMDSMWDRMGYEGRMQWYAQCAETMTTRLDALCGPHTDELHWKRGQMTLIFYPTSNRMLIF